MRLMTPLSEDELDELERFLLSELVPDDGMVLEILDGYLTAIVIGPTTLQPSQWLPGIWGPAAEDTPQFETTEQAQHILELILRHCNGIIWSLQNDADAFEPLIDGTTYPGDEREYFEGDAWAFGFMQGVELCRPDWQPLFDDVQGQAILRSLYLLGADDVSPEDAALIRSSSQREALAKTISADVAAIYRYWLPHRKTVHERKIAAIDHRATPKIGRNDPCPCGSGKKFKKCCGAAAVLH
jgi:uncharacterized protein